MITGQSGDFVSRAMLRLPGFKHTWNMPRSWIRGVKPRVASPVRGFSTLTTSAPKSASTRLATGPGM